MSTNFAIGQLRHLYKQMLDGSVKDTKGAAKGLLGPAIEMLEQDRTVKDLAEESFRNGARVTELELSLSEWADQLEAAGGAGLFIAQEVRRRFALKKVNNG